MSLRKFFSAALTMIMSMTAVGNENLNIVFIGNSITHGAGLSDPAADAPPVKCGRWLREHGFGDVRVFNAGRNGCTTVDFLPGDPSRLFDRIVSAADSLSRLDGRMVFSMMLGTNDSASSGTKGAPVSRTDYRSNLLTIVDSLLLRYPQAIVLLHRPLWYSPNTHNRAVYLAEGLARLDGYYAELRAICADSARAGRVFLGDTRGYDRFVRTHSDEMFAENGRKGVFYLHPNEAGGTALAALWGSAIADALTLSSELTDAYIKLNTPGRPRVCSVAVESSTAPADSYNSIFGHGAVLENPWLAFRVYFDNRQSIDLYAKTSPRLELEQTGFYTTPEQLAQGYGRDVLWAGESVAAGSFRGWQGHPATIDSVALRAQRVEDRSTVIISDSLWTFNGHAIDMTQRYSVAPDSRELSVEIILKGYEADDVFCTGVQKLAGHEGGYVLPLGRAASWGTNVPDASRPDLPAAVGLGVEVDPANVAGVREDDLNYLILLRPDADGRIRYRVTARPLAADPYSF